jgi:hypothetical protein
MEEKMRKKMKTVICAVTCTVWLLSLLSAGYACQVDDFYLTKEGYLAAVSPQTLNDVLSQTPDNQTQLTDMLNNGTVLRLKEGVKVQVLERSIEWNMLKIQFPDGKAIYWVKDGSLKPINCNK